MAYPSQFQYLTVIGDAYAAAERWQFGLKLTNVASSNEEVALAASDDVERWWMGLSPYSSGVDKFNPCNTHRLTEVKVARIETNGEYVDGQPAYSHFYLPPLQTSDVAPAGMAPQNTMCATLTTDLPRGYASKGRIFLPPCNTMLPTADGRISAANANVLAASVKRLINELNANTAIGNVAVFSRGRGVPAYDAEHNRIEYTYPNDGAVNAVTGVRVGRVVDTQRRRRRQLAETYEVVQLA